MKILKSKNGNQSFNKKCAYELEKSLNPGCTEIEAAPRKQKSKLISTDEKLIFVSAYTAKKAAMIVKPSDRAKVGEKPSKKIKPFLRDVDIWAMVRQREETILIYFISDIPRLMSLKGQGTGVSGSAVSWDNVSSVSDKVVVITSS